MQERDRISVQPVGVCERLYSFITSVFTVHRLANHSPDSSSSEESESDSEFWEVEDSTASDEFNGASEDGESCKGKKKTSQAEACYNRRELQQVQELGMYDGISLSLVQENSGYRSSAKYHPLRYANGAWKPGSPDMMRRQSMNTEIAKERSQEVGVKNRKSKIISRVFSNINERSDAFIRSRKEAMRKSYSVGSKMI